MQKSGEIDCDFGEYIYIYWLALNAGKRRIMIK